MEMNEESSMGAVTPPAAEAARRVPDKWLVGLQLSQLAVFLVVLPLGNLIAPFVIWRLGRESAARLDRAAREVLNFQFSITLYLFISLLLWNMGIGVLLFFATLVFDVMMIVQGVRAAERGRIKHYPLTIQFIRK